MESLREKCPKGIICLSDRTAKVAYQSQGEKLDNKVAIAFFGLTGSFDSKYGEGQPLDPTLAARYTVKNVIKKNNSDCFVHTWSHEQVQNLRKLYGPSWIEGEELDDTEWKAALAKAPVGWWFNLFVKGLSRGSRGIKGEYKAAKNSWFRYRSTSKVLSGVAKYAQENEVEYEYVLLTRLDLAHFTPFTLSEVREGQVLVSHWNQVEWQDGKLSHTQENLFVGHAFLDLWFAFRFEDIDYVRQVSECFFDYDPSQHRVMYEHLARKNFSPVYRRFRGVDYELIRRFMYDSQV